ncbi:MAG: inositol monophosphatase family protein [Candidatus Gracilibacteria bacterium]
MPIHLLQIAKKLAYDAGKLALKYQQKGFSVYTKGDNPLNLVTDADRACEELIIKTIKSNFPDHSILSEESGAFEGGGEYKWIIDPIDGTSNFAHGLPLFAISIAVIHKGKPIIGVVEVPGLNETFWAQQGKGAFLNNKKIEVSKTGNIASGLFTTGFSYDRKSPRYAKNMSLFDAFYTVSHGVRRIGTAALDLCFVASGRYEGFWEYDLEPWDVAAGKIILEEAGGTVTNMDGSPFNPKLKNVLASNGILHSEMLRIIREHGGDKV